MTGQCDKCQSPLYLTQIEQEFEVEKYDHPCVVDGILAFVCNSCGHTVVTPEGSKYIEQQLSIFKRNGALILVQQVAEEEGSTLPVLAEMLGLKKANFHKKLFGGDKIDLIFCFEIATKLNRDFKDCFQYYPILLRDGRYYLDKTESNERQPVLPVRADRSFFGSSQEYKNKTIPIFAKPHIQKMYDQVLSKLNENGSKTNRSRYFSEWVVQQWIENCGEYFIDLPDDIIYFQTEEDKQENEKLLSGYTKRGLSIDDQMIEIICERSNAYSVRKK